MASEIHICLNNFSVASNIGQILNGSSQGIFKNFRNAAKTWLQISKQITVLQIFSHMGIKENEIANKKAKNKLNFYLLSK